MAASWCRRWNKVLDRVHVPACRRFPSTAIAGATTYAADAADQGVDIRARPTAQQLIVRDSKLTAALPVGSSVVQLLPPSGAAAARGRRGYRSRRSSVSNREAHDRKRSSPRGEDDARGAVHQRRSRHAGKPREAASERLLGHGRRGRAPPRCPPGRRCRRGPPRRGRAPPPTREVPRARRRGTRPRLPAGGQVGVVARGRALHPAAGALARHLGRGRRPPHDRGDLPALLGTANMSRSTNASRSAGAMRSSTTSSASPTLRPAAPAARRPRPGR